MRKKEIFPLFFIVWNRLLSRAIVYAIAASSACVARNVRTTEPPSNSGRPVPILYGKVGKHTKGARRRSVSVLFSREPVVVHRFLFVFLFCLREHSWGSKTWCNERDRSMSLFKTGASGLGYAYSSFYSNAHTQTVYTLLK